MNSIESRMKMTTRYKHNPEEVRYTNSLNIHGLSEVNMGDDLAFIKDLEVQLSSGEWKCMSQAFRDRDIITDNYNQWFREPKNQEEKERGFYY